MNRRTAWIVFAVLAAGAYAQTARPGPTMKTLACGSAAIRFLKTGTILPSFLHKQRS